ncbi:MAG: CDP-paratose 2-epimerase [candidate division Zixibacteria bacterium]|nr:CDP-paratose 2-epimerase [candidate division Zixibacteria bacterium]
MKVYHLKKQQYIARPREEVFEFFGKAENLEKITPGSLGFNIITPTPINMRAGTLIDYTVKPMIFPIRWRTLITDYDPPRRFVDEQLKGPYSFWHHTHTFEEKDGGTLITDEVRYVIPFGIIGRIAHVLFVKSQLKKIFDFREKVISEIFAS